MSASFYRDDPWRRLPAEVLAALLLTLLTLILFYEFLTANNHTLPPPKPVVMDIVVLPPKPAPAPTPRAAAPAAPAQTLPLPTQVRPETRPAPPQPRQEAVPRETPRAAEATPAYPAPPRSKPTIPPSEHVQAAPRPKAPIAPATPLPAPREQATETLPPAATAPLTAAEQQMIAARRLKIAKDLYQPGGRGSATQEPGHGTMTRGPLSPEEWKALDEEFFVGTPLNFITMLAQWAPLRAAMSPHAPPLTREQWDALDRIYHVGGYEKYQDYREAAARAKRLQSPTELAELTPDERHFILASRGVLPLSHGPTLQMSYKLKLVDGTYMAAYNQRGSPPVVLHEVTPELPEALLKPPAQWNAVVRLQIDRLASTKIELTGSTGNDTVDHAVLDALRSWRFRSAFYGYSLPMASTDELRISLVVK
jgi:outer membrane biosynthesis protein TonB